MDPSTQRLIDPATRREAKWCGYCECVSAKNFGHCLCPIIISTIIKRDALCAPVLVPCASGASCAFERARSRHNFNQRSSLDGHGCAPATQPSAQLSLIIVITRAQLFAASQTHWTGAAPLAGTVATRTDDHLHLMRIISA